jgi:hypothetical protein
LMDPKVTSCMSTNRGTSALLCEAEMWLKWSRSDMSCKADVPLVSGMKPSYILLHHFICSWILCSLYFGWIRYHNIRITTQSFQHQWYHCCIKTVCITVLIL